MNTDQGYSSNSSKEDNPEEDHRDLKKERRRLRSKSSEHQSQIEQPTDRITQIMGGIPKDQNQSDFYLRYYVGHKGKFGHEFLEFEFKPNGRLRYANNSQYKADSFLGKEVFVNNIILEELKRIVHQSGILEKSDNNWPEPDNIGKQELEIVVGN